VLAAFERSAYLDLAGRVVAVAADGVGRGPFAIVVRDQSAIQPVRVGDPVRLEGGMLWIGQHGVDVRAADAWDPALAAFGETPVEPREGALEDVIEALKAGTPRESIVPLLDPVPVGSRGTARPLLDSLRDGLEAIGAFLTGRIDAVGVSRAIVSTVAGRGPGLTPSGDDLLVGIMHAMTVWPARVPQTGCREGTRLFAEAALPHTTRISAAYLEAAACGQATEPWHDLVRSLKQSRAARCGTVRRLLHVGETSGADALTGFCWAWRLRLA
jgi:hypothetical protein